MTATESQPMSRFVNELSVVTPEFGAPPPSVSDCPIDELGYAKEIAFGNDAYRSACGADPIVRQVTKSHSFFDTDVCFGCGGYILDRYLLHVNNQPWHLQCLRCYLCGVELEQFPSCHVKDDRAYCKQCYTRQFGVKCTRCGRIIQPTDWVRRARQFVYHLACFACDACKRQLSTGEEFALQDCRVLCKQHYMELLDGDSAKGHQKQKTKRVRTTFSEEQLQVLQANFQIDSNPDGQDLERIAQITGLSKRVTQVWFQNSRARQKKYQGSKGRGSQACSSGDELEMGQNCMDDGVDMDEGGMDGELSPCRSIAETMVSCSASDCVDNPNDTFGQDN